MITAGEKRPAVDILFEAIDDAITNNKNFSDVEVIFTDKQHDGTLFRTLAELSQRSKTNTIVSELRANAKIIIDKLNKVLPLITMKRLHIDRKGKHNSSCLSFIDNYNSYSSFVKPSFK